MQCPACDKELVSYNAGRVVVDICRTGCSGIWFDKNELTKCDDKGDPFPPELLRILKFSNVPIDRARTRKCPKCVNQVLSQRLYDDRSQIEIDACLNCGGHWLDIGELEGLRAENKAAANRQAAIEDFTKRHAAELKDADALWRVKAILQLIF